MTSFQIYHLYVRVTQNIVPWSCYLRAGNWHQFKTEDEMLRSTFA